MAECHGSLCGYLCVSDFLEIETWKEYLSVEINTELMASRSHKDMEELFEGTIELLMSSEFNFQLLLPDDTLPISVRVLALGEWCHGFLNGCALGGTVEKAIEDEEIKELIEELIENLTKICHYTFHFEAGDDSDESNEKALFELVEYVRMGAMFIYSHYNCRQLEAMELGVCH